MVWRIYRVHWIIRGMRNVRTCAVGRAFRMSMSVMPRMHVTMRGRVVVGPVVTLWRNGIRRWRRSLIVAIGLTRKTCRSLLAALCTVLALVWPALDAFLPFFPNTVHAGIRNTILNAALAGTRLVTALACTGAVGARHLDLFALGTRRVLWRLRPGHVRGITWWRRRRGIGIYHARRRGRIRHEVWARRRGAIGGVRVVRTVGEGSVGKVWAIGARRRIVASELLLGICYGWMWLKMLLSSRIGRFVWLAGHIAVL